MRRALVAVLSAALLLGGLVQVPSFAGASPTSAAAARAVPATVTAGTAALYTSDSCSSPPQPAAARWIYALDLTLALRLNGRQRTMTIGAPWTYPPNWPDYSGGDRSVPCDYRTLPTMSFVGTATDGPSLATEPVHGYCWGSRRLLGSIRLGCRLSIHGRSPFELEMALTDVYDAYGTEHSAGEDVNSTFVVSGVQHVAPSS